MEIKRQIYLQQLIDKKHNTMVKIVSGVRRCGKSYLLFHLFKQHLLSEGVTEENIITIALDGRAERKYRDPDVCYDYVLSRLQNPGMHYLLLDEVQLMEDFESVLNGLLRLDNLDIYVTGSNSRFLSTDVITEFRGRGDEVRVFPLSFAEFFSTKNCYWQEAWEEYMLYGGMPLTLALPDSRQKMKYLRDLFTETYLRDLIERNHLKNNAELEELVNIVASDIGCLLNPNKLANVFASVKRVKLSAPTISLYLDHLQDAFIISKAERYDIKGNRYIDSPFKYYFVDVGLRNARLRFRQTEAGHIMENIIYNELVMRGFQVDIGSIATDEKLAPNSRERKRVEVDFVANMGSKRYYIQSSLSLGSESKAAQEKRPLLAIQDSFKKILIVQDSAPPHYDEQGILILSIKDFLLNPDSLME